MKSISPGRITTTVDAFLREDSELAPSRRRERSWDFCFNHFQDNQRPTDAMELSSLHLGYYLASWGMLRGSSFLFKETNVMHYQKAIEVIEEHNDGMSGFDVLDYRDPDKKDALDAAWRDLSKALLPPGRRNITLVSKVMMGVWGCIPSFDTFFMNTFKTRLSETKKESKSFDRVGVEALGHLADLYDQHAAEIEQVRHQHTTWDMTTGQQTGRPMTCAKVLDIYGFHAAFSKG